MYQPIREIIDKDIKTEQNQITIKRRPINTAKFTESDNEHTAFHR